MRAKKLLQNIDKKSGLDAMVEAQSYADEVGFSYRNIDEVMAQVRQENQELLHDFKSGKEAMAEEIGDNLFVLLRLCQWLKLDPNELFIRNTQKFLKRMVVMEQYLQENNRTWDDVSDWEEVWREAKKGYKSNSL